MNYNAASSSKYSAVAVLLLCASSVWKAGAFVVGPPASSRLAVPQHRRRIPSSLASSGSYANTTTTSTSPSYKVVQLDQLWDQKQRLKELLVEQQPQQPQQAQQQTTAATATTSTDNDQDVWNARFLLIGAAALYGTNFSFVKLLGDIMPVGVSSTLRFGLAALATLPWLLQKNQQSETGENASDDNESFRAAAAGFEVGMWNSVGYIAQAVGLETTDASKSAFLCSLAVVVVPLLDFMFGKKLLPREVAGVVMAVLGVAVLELGDAATATSAVDSASFSISSGDICSLIQPLAFGLGFWRMESAMRQYPHHANRSTAAQLMAVFLASAVYGTAVGAFPDGATMWAWVSDPQILLALFWTGCVTTALTVYMETLALKTLSAAETTLIFSTEPLWGSACASVVMSEQLGLGTLGGGAMILAGCVVSNLGLEGILACAKNAKLPSLSSSQGWITSITTQLLTTGIVAPVAAAFAMEADSVDNTKSSVMDAVVEEVIQKAADAL